MSMTPILPVTKVSVTTPTPQDAAGPAPQLEWLRIDRLVVDDSYQRPVTEVGRRNIRKIAEGFNWSAFSPVVVSPVAGGLYAIVDGQHRTTAAALCGFETVPCQIILANRGGQAAAFAAINGVTTRMHSMAVHKAAVAAGDERAVRVERVAAAAKVTVLRYPKSTLTQEPGETMAVGALNSVIDRFGEPVAVLALRVVRETPNDARGTLLAPIIDALGQVLAEPDVRARPAADVIRAFGTIKIIREFDRALDDARQRGVSRATALAGRLLARLRVCLAAAA